MKKKRGEWAAIQPAVAKAARDAADHTLADLARALGQSPFHAHRTLSSVLGETPKQYTLRLRLERAAALLLTTRDTVLDVALTCGFDSAEVFLRAFRRQFGITPSAYRKRGLRGNAPDHASLVAQIGPCAGLIHMDSRLNGGTQKGKRMSDYTIEVQELEVQPVVLVKRRVPRAEIGPTIGKELPSVFQYTQANGIGIGGHPVTRYPEFGLGMVTLETGMRVTKFEGAWQPNDSDGGPYRSELPGGPVASTIHAGPYDGLVNAYAALEQWIAANGKKASGAPWEVYVNDPGDHPDPKDWKTEIFWPIERS